MHSAPDDALKEYRHALTATQCRAPDDLERRMIEDLHRRDDIKDATADQVSAWEQLIWLATGNLEVSWDPRLKTPTSIRTWQQFDGAAADAMSALDRELMPIIKRMLSFDPARDSITRAPTESSPMIGFPGSATGGTSHRFRCKRLHDGLPVVGAFLNIVVVPSPLRSGSWMASVSANWPRDLPDARTPPAIAAEKAEALAVASDPGSSSTLERNARLVIAARHLPPRLVYEVEIRDDAGDPWLVLVDAATGVIVSRSIQVRQ
ncbi:MAG: PepSY domain-containing protein [Deltaproteobacteria bacterium]|nr:PepSY domain-containing protein [Deltaproteobacteria bacterium]